MENNLSNGNDVWLELEIIINYDSDEHNSSNDHDKSNTKYDLDAYSNNVFIANTNESRIVNESCSRENNDDTFHCKYCSKKFTSKNKFKAHLFWHFLQNSKICNEQNSLTTNSEKSQTPISEIASSFQNPYNNISILHQENLIFFQCKICLKKFKTISHIKYHELCGQINDESQFKCLFCEKTFRARSHFYYHLKVHTGERPYACQECGKHFIQKNKLTRHMRTHTEERPFGCDTCDKRYNNSDNLKQHKLTHTGERPYMCSICGKLFALNTILRKHYITHTDNKPTPCSRKLSLSKRFLCMHCSKPFTSSMLLKRHVLSVHATERPFKCEQCESAFKRKDNFDRHCKSRHGIENTGKIKC